ncbi:hypothetical protein BJ970_004034 [Saccharopolyspora phatthalungensis]|uniref:Uncharacterized protein n=1 Tax=Saccharopolyspora phatthalungensis TaxID=664693 RepID=A0A840Q9I6_9PSEU|nr:hypothetical protein [Saccharopolyspora phatthalungensis]
MRRQFGQQRGDAGVDLIAYRPDLLDVLARLTRWFS